MATVEANGTTLFYTLFGQGPTCLVLHGGLGLDHTVYRTLDPLGEYARLVYYDQRGNGRSGRPALDTLTMEQLADDAASLASHLATGRVVVFGHSYGGFVAQEFALRHPDRVASLVLCSTTPGQLGTGETEAESSGPPPPPEFVELISSPPDTDQGLAEKMRGMQELLLHRRDRAEVGDVFADTIFNVATMNRGFEVLSTWSSVDRLPSIDVPTLLIVGSHDTFTSPSQSYRIARRIPDSRVLEFEQSGHMPWLDEPERFYDAVADWLKHQST